MIAILKIIILRVILVNSIKSVTVQLNKDAFKIVVNSNIYLDNKVPGPGKYK
jgi:hypothetical protein